MSVLGNDLYEVKHHEDALSVGEAELSMLRRLGAAEIHILIAQSNLANTYRALRRFEEALLLRRESYARRLRLSGEEDEKTLTAANNYAASLGDLQRFKEAKALLRKTIPVARRVLGERDQFTLLMRRNYAEALWRDNGATLDDLREAVRTLEETERIARRVFGGAHPITTGIERFLRNGRAALAARVGDGVSSVCEGVAAMTAKGA